MPWPNFLFTETGGTRGPLGSLIDFWVVEPSGYATGQGFGGDYKWFHWGCLLWPNPSGVPPTLA
jgi:hypothetical protein